eukprot:RCo046381
MAAIPVGSPCSPQFRPRVFFSFLGRPKAARNLFRALQAADAVHQHASTASSPIAAAAVETAPIGVRLEAALLVAAAEKNLFPPSRRRPPARRSPPLLLTSLSIDLPSGFKFTNGSSPHQRLAQPKTCKTQGR